MSEFLLTNLQHEFKCSKCGLCCSVGGDMVLTMSDLIILSGYLRCHISDRVHLPVELHPDHPGKFRFTLNRPCFFQDKASGECTVYPARPQACKDYPFELYLKGGCNHHGAMVCPEAIKQLDELFCVSSVV